MSPTLDGQGVARFRVTLGGASFDQVRPRGLTAILVDHDLDLCGMATVSVGGVEQEQAWRVGVGDECGVSLGDCDVELFSGEVVSIEHHFSTHGGSGMVIRAMEPMHRLGRSVRTRSWEHVLASELVEQVASEHGVPFEVDRGEQSIPYLLQDNESDAALLRRVARLCDFRLAMDRGRLVFRREGRAPLAARVVMGEGLVSAKFHFDAAALVQSVVVTSWDEQAKELVRGTADARGVESISAGPLGIQVSEALGPASVCSASDSVADGRSAGALAAAELARRARGFCTGTATVRGDTTVEAGGLVRFEGLRERVDGDYLVTAVRHRLRARSGFVTDFEFCSNAQGA